VVGGRLSLVVDRGYYRARRVPTAESKSAEYCNASGSCWLVEDFLVCGAAETGGDLEMGWNLEPSVAAWCL
jgi:hypothetical protein